MSSSIDVRDAAVNRYASTSSSFAVLQAGERMRVGHRFLRMRPRITALGAMGNAVFLSHSGAPSTQRWALAFALVTTVGAFFVEARWLAGRALSERWLFVSLSMTLAALGIGALLSGGLVSPLLPLFFAPVIVGVAAFSRTRFSWLLLGMVSAVLFVLYAVCPLPGFLPIPAPSGMLLVSSLVSLSLLGVGVIGLVDAHERIARDLDRLRGDMLQEAERRASSIEHLGAEVAHEVKNPLAAARGLVQLVSRHLVDERDVTRLSVVVTEIDRALAVLQDYLSFARPLSDLKLSAVHLRNIFEDVRGVLEARAHEKGIWIHIDCPPLELIADGQRLRDAVLNLALNAVAVLSRGGKLELLAVRVGDQVQLSVVDDGPGMSEEVRSRLGQPFASATLGGTGLGVMLAASVARQHGGDLRFEAVPKGGTCAVLTLPCGAGKFSRKAM